MICIPENGMECRGDDDGLVDGCEIEGILEDGHIINSIFVEIWHQC